MSRNRKWFRESPYGKYRMLEKIQQNPGRSAIEIAERHPRGTANIREHVKDGFVENRGNRQKGELYITSAGTEMLRWQDENFGNESKQEYDRG